MLIAFGSTIAKIIGGIWNVVAAVPVFIYQSIFLLGSFIGLIRPDLIWESQSFYVDLLSSFSTLIVIGWIVEYYENLAYFLKKIFKFGIPISCVISFYGMIYFGVLALDFKENMLPAVVFRHLIVLFGYIVTFKNVPEYTAYFNVGIQYYCTIALLHLGLHC